MQREGQELFEAKEVEAMGRAFAILFALVVVGSPAGVSAQTVAPATDHYDPLAKTESPDGLSMKTIQGSIQSMDPARKTLTLTDGTTLIIPASITSGPGILRQGAMVTAIYQEEGARKVVILIQIESPPARA